MNDRAIWEMLTYLKAARILINKALEVALEDHAPMNPEDEASPFYYQQRLEDLSKTLGELDTEMGNDYL